MERTARDIVGASFLQSNEVTYHIHDLSRVENPVYGILRYHILLLVNLFVLDVLHILERILLLCRLFLRRSLVDLILIDGLLHLP